MNCFEFEVAVQCLVESRGRRLPDGAAVHLQSCAECAGLWQGHRLVEAALVAWRPVEIPAGLTESVMHRLTEQTGWNSPARTDAVAVRGRSHAAPAQWGVLVASAACLIVSVWFGLAARQIDRGREVARTNSPPVETDATRPNASSLPTEPAVDVAESVVAVFDDLRGEYHELAEATKATARDIVAVLPVTGPASWLEGVTMASIVPSKTIDSESPGEGSSPGAVSQIGRSIGDQIGQAIDFLRVAVPTSVPQG